MSDRGSRILGGFGFIIILLVVNLLSYLFDWGFVLW